MIEKIEHNGVVLGIVLRAETDPETTVFYTGKESPLQLGVVKHEQGYVEPAHFHKKTEKVITEVFESIQMQYGTAELEFYNEQGNLISSCILNPGDTIVYGGIHRIKAVSTFKAIKIKQGPYTSLEDDKLFIEVKG
jgi:hypothetical protein